MHFNIHFIDWSQKKKEKKKLRTYNEFPIYFWKDSSATFLRSIVFLVIERFMLKRIIFDQARYISIDTESVPPRKRDVTRVAVN